MKKLRRNVISLLEDYPHVAQNYNLLVATYWWNCDGVRGLAEVQFATPAESIARMCRKLVAEGVVQLPNNIKRLRKKREVEFRNEFSKKV